MDAKILQIIQEQRRLWPGLKDMDTFVRHCSQSGMFWLEDEINSWERDMDFDELEIRSALEFLRPELTARQISYLEAWDAMWQEFRTRGVFHQRVQESYGGRFTWEAYRRETEEELGRPIPKSHWWFWPELDPK